MPTRLRTGILALVLVLPAAACSKRTDAPVDGRQDILSGFEPFPADAGAVVHDLWYAIELQDQPAGGSHLRISRHETPGGTRLVISSEEKVSLRRGQSPIEVHTADRSLQDPNGFLLRQRHEEHQTGGTSLVIEAGRRGQQMIALRGPEVVRVDFEAEALGAQLPYLFLLANKPVKTGELLRFRTYSPETAGYTDNQVKVTRAPAAAGESLSLEHTVSALPGVLIRSELDPAHLPLTIETTMGALRLRLRRTEGKPGPAAPPDAPDLDPIMTVKSNIVFPSRDAVAYARYRLEGFPAEVPRDWLEGPGQTVAAHPAAGVFVVDVRPPSYQAALPFPMRVTDPALSEWLSPTALAQSEDPEVRAVAARVTKGSKDSWEAAKRLRRWVSDEIASDMGMAFASAREVLQRRRGDCSEQAVLLAALARAAGLPSRCAMGLVFLNGSFARHMWTEVWVDDWRPLDPAMEEDALSAAWIRLGTHGLRLTEDGKTGTAGMLAFASDLKVTVEKHELRGR